MRKLQPGAWLRWVAIGLVCAVLAAPASAVTLVEAETARFEWTPSSGPVESYLVLVSRNDGPMLASALRPAAEPWIDVSGQPGDELQVQVQARSSRAGASQLSPVSEKVRLVEPRPSFPDVFPPVVTPAAPADFDGDGRTDLLFRNVVTGELKIWLLGWLSIDEVTDVGGLAPDQQVVGTADYDGDGYADLLLHDTARDELEIRYLVGGHRATAATLDISPGWRVATSAGHLWDSGASIFLHQETTGALERVDASGRVATLWPLPARVPIVASLDLDDSGVVRLIYQDAGGLVARSAAGVTLTPVATGGDIPQGATVAGACSLPGRERDVLLVSGPGRVYHRLGFAQNNDRLLVEPIEGLGGLLGTTPGVGAGDFDADGDCDLAIAAATGELWLVLLDGNRAEFSWQIPSPGANWVPAAVGAETPRLAP